MSTGAMTRVASRDGTEIAYWTSGEGPPLVLVHGTASLHTTWNTLLPYLEPHAAVHVLDRRGRGASGDAADYELAREFEDVAAVVDAVAQASGATVDLLGHSFGGIAALGAAIQTSNVRRLVLYEGWPALGTDTSAEGSEWQEALVVRLDALLADGNGEAALETFYRELVGMSDEELAASRTIPGWWKARVAAAHTVPRELRAEVAVDGAQLAAVPVPTLMLVGANSPDHIKGDYETVAATLPDARVTILEGQEHLAHLVAPELFGERLLAFLRGTGA